MIELNQTPAPTEGTATARVTTGRGAEPESGQPEEVRMRVAAERVSFIVRLSRDEVGRLSGVVERVRTGEKERFYDIDAIGPLIARMAGEERPPVPERGRGEPS